jgi:hypothetical protein
MKGCSDKVLSEYNTPSGHKCGQLKYFDWANFLLEGLLANLYLFQHFITTYKIEYSGIAAANETAKTCQERFLRKYYENVTKMNLLKLVYC